MPEHENHEYQAKLAQKRVELEGRNDDQLQKIIERDPGSIGECSTVPPGEIGISAEDMKRMAQEILEQRKSQ